MLGKPAVRRAVFAAFTLLAAVAGGVVACGTEAKGVEACKRIERVRCETAAACGIDLSRPVHRGDTPNEDVGSCIRYYEDACLHGLASGVEPGSVAVDDCVRALETGSCDLIRAPETSPACAFLVPVVEPPPAPPVDAGDPDADVPDGG